MYAIKHFKEAKLHKNVFTQCVDKLFKLNRNIFKHTKITKALTNAYSVCIQNQYEYFCLLKCYYLLLLAHW